MQLDIVDLDSQPEFIPSALGFDFAFGIDEQLNPQYGKYRVIQKDEYYSTEVG